MIWPVIAVIGGLVLVAWSADRFVDGAAAAARHFGMPALLIGMVIIGFGTSAPEMVVSALAALQGNPNIALGNAYGSNIANIGLVLGLTAVLAPITVHSRVLRKEVPILTGVTVLAAWQLWDLEISRWDAVVLLALFGVLMTWTVRQGLKPQDEGLTGQIERQLREEYAIPLGRALFWLFAGLVVLVGSSRLLVWGAVEVAQALGVSDLVIGLTVVAIGTSLPELASAIAAVRKNEHDIALGNVLGSNLFNTLAVVGIAGAIEPMTVSSEVLWRDIPVMGALTLSLFVIGYRTGRRGVINRVEGGVLVGAYVVYTSFLVISVFAGK